ncbi:MAG TPA: CPBP family intramembrane glutamic endopeptidase [Candidatus Angelobacter sp.]|nr:CPBP family intramembrane glutamic endopeptidase [Candidatus Angelobacter sp.]
MTLVEHTRVNMVDAPAPASPGPSTRRLRVAAGVFCALLIIFWFIAKYFQVQQVEDHPVSTLVSFALLFAPYWFFGFGAAEWLRSVLPRAPGRIGAAALLALPYFVLAIPRGEFHWTLAVTLVGLALLSAAVVETWKKPGNWADVFVLATAGLVIDLGLLNTSGPLAVPGTTLWPPGLGGFPKMMMMNVALYCYLVVKPLEGIGYDLTPRFSDVKTGLRELLFYMPVVLPLGFWLGFLQFHPARPPVFLVPAAWIFTFAFVAMPEELFFRGLVQNLLERRMARNLALLVASILFGLSHFNKHAGGQFLLPIAGHTLLFNWRYVLLATIAGIFYGRAWRDKRRLFASSITHASVDTVWSLLFRKAVGS